MQILSMCVMCNVNGCASMRHAYNVMFDNQHRDIESAQFSADSCKTKPLCIPGGTYAQKNIKI